MRPVNHITTSHWWFVCITAWCAVSSPALAQEQLLGSWAFALPDGNPVWLRIERIEAEPSEWRAELLWSVGSAQPVEVLEIAPQSMRFKRKIRWQPFGRGRVLTINQPMHAELKAGELRLIANQADAEGNEEKLLLIGKRMPPVPPRPDLNKVQFGPVQELFNGRDLSGWRLSNPEKKNGWSAERDVLVNRTPKTDFGAYGDFGNLRTKPEFKDFELSIEYNVEAGGNSGIYLRGLYEVQVVDRDSKMQGIQGPGAIFGRIKPNENAGKPGGEWNQLRLTLVDRHVSVELNGKLVIANEPVVGCTGGALSADDTAPGPILLQGDHTSVKYRNIRLRAVISRE
jgi:hypothetical protein